MNFLPAIDKRTRLVERYAWREPQGGVGPGLAKVDEVEVEVTVDWDRLASLAHNAAHNKSGRATAYHGAIEARVAKGTPRLVSQQPFEEEEKKSFTIHLLGDPFDGRTCELAAEQETHISGWVTVRLGPPENFTRFYPPEALAEKEAQS